VTAFGLRMSREERAADLAAYVQELQSAEARVATATNDADRAEWEGRVELIREQLALRGHEGAPPVKRATRRTRDAVAGTEER
jgi:hypothetical protein